MKMLLSEFGRLKCDCYNDIMEIVKEQGGEVETDHVDNVIICDGVAIGVSRITYETYDEDGILLFWGAAWDDSVDEVRDDDMEAYDFHEIESTFELLDIHDRLVERFKK